VHVHWLNLLVREVERPQYAYQLRRRFTNLKIYKNKCIIILENERKEYNYGVYTERYIYQLGFI